MSDNYDDLPWPLGNAPPPPADAAPGNETDFDFLRPRRRGRVTAAAPPAGPAPSKKRRRAEEDEQEEQREKKVQVTPQIKAQSNSQNRIEELAGNVKSTVLSWASGVGAKMYDGWLWLCEGLVGAVDEHEREREELFRREMRRRREARKSGVKGKLEQSPVTCIKSRPSRVMALKAKAKAKAVYDPEAFRKGFSVPEPSTDSEESASNASSGASTCTDQSSHHPSKTSTQDSTASPSECGPSRTASTPSSSDASVPSSFTYHSTTSSRTTSPSASPTTNTPSNPPPRQPPKRPSLRLTIPDHVSPATPNTHPDWQPGDADIYVNSHGQPARKQCPNCERSFARYGEYRVHEQTHYWMSGGGTLDENGEVEVLGEAEVERLWKERRAREVQREKVLGWEGARAMERRRRGLPVERARPYYR